MSTQETLITRKRRGPAPTGKGTLVGVRLLPPALATLDAWIAAQPDPKPSRPEAIRAMVRRWKNVITDYDAQIAFLEAGETRVLHNRKDVTADQLARVRQFREQLLDLIEQQKPD